MAKKIFSCRDIELPHEQMVSLRRLGKLNLGMDDLLAVNLPPSAPTKNSSIQSSFNFWRFVTFAVLIYSIFLSFTYQWWCFIPGIFIFGAMLKATNAGNVKNLLEAAMADKDFYENVRRMNGWKYQINENDAAPYLKT